MKEEIEGSVRKIAVWRGFDRSGMQMRIFFFSNGEVKLEFINEQDFGEDDERCQQTIIVLSGDSAYLLQKELERGYYEDLYRPTPTDEVRSA